MQRSDYHTHTPLCRHAEGTPELFVAAALSQGLNDYGIADHAPMPPHQEPYDEWRMLCSELPEYIEWINQARRAAAGTPLRILSGLECDWVPGIAPWVNELRRRYKWDYLIGSVHYLRTHESVDDALYADKSITGDVDEDWRLYWQAITEMIKSDLFDIVGHIDLVKIWGRVPKGDLMRYYTPALEVLEASSMAVEINTAGLYKRCAEQYPTIPLLRELLKRRIPIVINSDAHRPEHLSRDWTRATALLQELSGNKLRQINVPLKHSPEISLHAYGSL